MKLIGSLCACVCTLVLVSCASPARSPQGPPLQGIVYGSGGTALGSVEITAGEVTASVEDRRSSPPVAVRSGIDGRFTLPGSLRGRLTVTATRSGYESSTTTVTITDATQILYLRLRSAGDIVEAADRALASGRHEAARQGALEALGVAPDDPVVRFEAAAILLRAGDPGAAQRALDGLPVHRLPEAVTLLRDRIAGTEAAR